jgi:two-component system, LytTR family, response regulator
MKAIIIDDEPNAVELLEFRLRQHCPNIEVVAACTSSVKGVAAIRQYGPDLVFLDIEMPQLNGFQVLEAVEDIAFALVFVTAYDKFALKAFSYSAIDYLLKPVETQELIRAVARAEKQQHILKEQVQLLKQQLMHSSKPMSDKIALPYQNGVTFAKLTDVIYCEADDSYTKFFLTDGQHYLITKSLKEIQDLLEDRGFMRIHRQFIINLDHIKKFYKGEGSYIIMSNNVSIPVSRLQKDRLMDQFGWL